MVKTMLNELLHRTASWPDEDQQELADYARVIEARRTGFYRVTEAEQQALSLAIGEADRGELVPEETVLAADSKRGL